MTKQYSLSAFIPMMYFAAGLAMCSMCVNYSSTPFNLVAEVVPYKNISIFSGVEGNAVFTHFIQ